MNNSARHVKRLVRTRINGTILLPQVAESRRSLPGTVASAASRTKQRTIKGVQRSIEKQSHVGSFRHLISLSALYHNSHTHFHQSVPLLPLQGPVLLQCLVCMVVRNEVRLVGYAQQDVKRRQVQGGGPPLDARKRCVLRWFRTSFETTDSGSESAKSSN